jgi:hypothetical protein
MELLLQHVILTTNILETEEFYLLGCNAMYSIESLLATIFMMVSCLAYSLTLKIEKACSSKTLAYS